MNSTESEKIKYKKNYYSHLQNDIIRDIYNNK